MKLNNLMIAIAVFHSTNGLGANYLHSAYQPRQKKHWTTKAYQAVIDLLLTLCTRYCASSL